MLLQVELEPVAENALELSLLLLGPLTAPAIEDPTQPLVYDLVDETVVEIDQLRLVPLLEELFEPLRLGVAPAPRLLTIRMVHSDRSNVRVQLIHIHLRLRLAAPRTTRFVLPEQMAKNAARAELSFARAQTPARAARPEQKRPVVDERLVELLD